MVKWFRWSGLSVVLLLLVVQTKPFALGALSQGKSLLVRAKRSLSARSTGWLEQKVTAGDGAAQDNLGWSVAIDGNTAVIGAPNATINGHSSQGAAYIFSNSNGSWAQVAKLTANDGASFDTFGYSVAISGNTAVVGAWHAAINGNPLQGSAYLFTYADGQWSEQAKLTANDGMAFDDFGYSVGVSGDTAFICTPYALNSTGAIYVFNRSGTAWNQAQKLGASDGAEGDNLGWSAALDGDTALVGAPFASVGGNYQQGAAYTFTRSGGTWTEAQKLTANDGAASQYFGFSVALNGTTALVGAPDASGKINDSGAAYVFDGSGGTWNQVQKLAGSDGASGDQFGYKVALYGVVAVIGAPFADIGTNTEQGAGYVFNQDKDNWAETQKLIASDGVSYDNAGFAVATLRTVAVAHNVLNRPLYSVSLSGFVEVREERERSDRFVLRVTRLEEQRISNRAPVSGSCDSI